MTPTPRYDPRSDGARCDECPLGPRGCLRDGFWQPMQSEYHHDAAGRPTDQAVVVVSPPKPSEEDAGIPLCDQTNGGEWFDGLRTIGKHRTDFAIVPVTSCAFPGQPSGAWDRATKKLDRINKRREKEGLAPHPHPADCCRPRLLKEVSRFKNIICLGKRAMHAVSGDSRSILRARGDFIEFTDKWQRLHRDPETQGLYQAGQPMPEDSVGHRVFPTMEPGFIARSPGWRHYWHVDLGKAVRWFEDRLKWIEPKLLLYPTPQQLRDWFAVTAPFWVVDVETDGIIALETYLRCVGFATPDMDPKGRPVMPGQAPHMVARSVGIDLLSGDGVTRHMEPDAEAEVLDVLRWVLSNRDMLKVGHNCLHTGTPVVLADGSSRPIEKLVRSKYAGEVLAANEEGKMVPARVTGWFRERVENQSWLVIRHENMKGGAWGLTLTPDHQVYLERGLTRADEVVPGDKILSKYPALDEYRWQAALGTALGDSSMKWSTTRGGSTIKRADGALPNGVLPRLTGGHTCEMLVEQKVRWMSGLFVRRGVEHSGSGYRDSTFYPYSMLTHPALREMYPLLFDGNRRIITRKTLDALGPVGLAWWYMDDGCKQKRPEGRREPMLLALCRYSDKEREVTRKWCEKRFGPTTITGNGCIRFGAEASGVLAKYIAPYVLPAARYKLPRPDEHLVEAWPEFMGYPEYRPTPHLLEIVSVEEYTPKRDTKTRCDTADTRWCLQTTEGNFMTGFGLVKNCGQFDRLVLERLGHPDGRKTFYPRKPVLPWLPPVDTECPIEPVLDTLFLSRHWKPELPKGLKTVGTVLTDIGHWEATEGGESGAVTENDRDRLLYNTRGDTVVNARITQPLVQYASERGYFQTIRLGERIKSPAWKDE